LERSSNAHVAQLRKKARCSPDPRVLQFSPFAEI
jgi:hypothetical protein